jgi:uncharacterized protein
MAATIAAMLFLLSPAKTLDFETPAPAGLAHTLPDFRKQSDALIAILRGYSPQQISGLMDLSDALATLNVARYAAHSSRYTTKNAKQAALAFNGDVYEGLDAKSLSLEDLQWAQQHLRHLSGLYGILRPLDRIQPHRLEMGTSLPNERGTTLYKFWGAQIAHALNAELKAQPKPVVINLASQEYFKAVDRKALKAEVIECVFEDGKAGAFKVISFNAKRARGLMARYAIQNRITHAPALQDFKAEGYRFAKGASEPQKWVFRRVLST